MKVTQQNTIKKGDFVKVRRIDFWQASEYEWEEYDPGTYRYAVVVSSYHGSFNMAKGYDTWRVRFVDGTTGVHHAKDMIILAQATKKFTGAGAAKRS